MARCPRVETQVTNIFFCKHGTSATGHCSLCYGEELERNKAPDPPRVPSSVCLYDPPPVPAALENTLQERHARYGTYLETAQLITDLKEIMHATPSWPDLEADQKESLDLIANKIGRLLRGDANYVDSWHDIAGYATLIEKRLNGEPL